MIALAILEIGVVGFMGSSLANIKAQGLGATGILTLLLLGGVVAFIAIMTTSVAVLAALGLTNRAHAFGLPEGSVRAIIALCLIIIFAITSVYLYGQLCLVPSTIKIDGLTSQQLAEIPENELIFKQPNAINPELFDVYLRQARNETSEDFAQQILTTMGTLVVAVAGFYFGTQAVAVAKQAIEGATLRILQPGSPAKLGKDIMKLPIRLETKPAGLAIEGRVNGHIDEALKQIRYDEFEFSRPAETPSTLVELTFSLVASPEVTQTLTVTIEAPEVLPA